MELAWGYVADIFLRSTSLSQDRGFRNVVTMATGQHDLTAVKTCLSQQVQTWWSGTITHTHTHWPDTADPIMISQTENRSKDKSSVLKHTHCSVYSKTWVLHTHTHTLGIHIPLCFALIHNGTTLTFPSLQLFHTRASTKQCKQSSVALEDHPDVLSLSFFSFLQLSFACWFGSSLNASAPRPPRFLRPITCPSTTTTTTIPLQDKCREARLCCLVFYLRENSSKCWELLIKVTMINNDWCCNYRPIAALFDVEF